MLGAWSRVSAIIGLFIYFGSFFQLFPNAQASSASPQNQQQIETFQSSTDYKMGFLKKRTQNRVHFGEADKTPV